MTTQELYLKTLFCCMACDGTVAEQELETLKTVAQSTPLLIGLDWASKIQDYVAQIHQTGEAFLTSYLQELADASLTDEEQLRIVALAFQMIDADACITYQEVCFFKQIRAQLSLSDEQILAQHPDKDEFLLPDIKSKSASSQSRFDLLDKCDFGLLNLSKD